MAKAGSVVTGPNGALDTGMSGSDIGDRPHDDSKPPGSPAT